MSGYKLFLLVSFVVIIVIFAVALSKGFHKDSSVRPKYDERQMLIRGKGYMIAFYSMIIVMCLMPVALTDNVKQFLGDNIYFLPLAVGLPIHVIYCIWNNAYIELNLNYKKWIIYMIFVGLYNLFLGLTAYWSGRLIEDGVLQANVLNLYLGVLMIVIIVVLVIKNAIDRREDDEDDDEESEA
jgi:hypothetical protein